MLVRSRLGLSTLSRRTMARLVRRPLDAEGPFVSSCAPPQPDWNPPTAAVRQHGALGKGGGITSTVAEARSDPVAAVIVTLPSTVPVMNA